MSIHNNHNRHAWHELQHTETSSATSRNFTMWVILALCVSCTAVCAGNPSAPKANFSCPPTTAVGGTCSATCAEGFGARPPVTSTCLPTGVWDKPKGRCSPMGKCMCWADGVGGAPKVRCHTQPTFVIVTNVDGTSMFGTMLQVLPNNNGFKVCILGVPQGV